ncbi:putative transcriptional regulator [Kitasatospora setae KM-6054]|uniref:Putative transcriptional regulator n=1 Tax=Kitasatospora setae (strain ATCC 33774 / DSM 43861 / JCM 3304 / KCC A-0304 / NBRC 14216 / KM-6054) TaxID=452652 RepID=E4NAA7_KITSK|nr:putative transcriptional regulator [Kitasatospora setae KM-6054]
MSSPALRFGRELARSRGARGWSQTALAKRMGYANSYVSLIERGKRALTFTFAVKADEVFETGARFQELYRLYSSSALLEGFSEFAEAEAGCSLLRTFQLSVVPGQLQTPAYAAALAAAAVHRGDITEAQAETRVSLLAARQESLRRADPPLVHAVMDEGCIRRPIGGRRVMAEQLAYLESLANSPHFMVQVAPFDLAERVPFRMPVVLLTLADRSILGYAESLARGHVERDRKTVTAWSGRYDRLQVESLSMAASLARIQAVRKELE